MRAICGAIRPIKLSGPTVSVAIAVSVAASSKMLSLVGVRAIPTERAVAPPNGRIVSQRLHSGANNINTPAIAAVRIACGASTE
ncbi:hypothetical protein D3C77_581660 [compost metagenome]